MTEKGEAGYSEVVATIILTGLTIVGASIVAIFMFALSPGAWAPNVHLRAFAAGTENESILTFSHNGGQIVPLRDLSVVVATQDNLYVMGADNLRLVPASDKFSPLENLIAPLPEEIYGSPARMSLVHRPSGAILASLETQVPYPVPSSRMETYYMVYSDGPPIIPTGTDIYVWAEVPLHTTSIALDSLGRPHVVGYVNAYNFHHIIYAFRDGSSWNVQIVDNLDWYGCHPAMALDSSNRPHIVYGDYAGGYLARVKYAYYNGSSWQIQTIDTQGPARNMLSIALGPDGRPHVIYGYYWGGALRYARYDGTSWNIQTICNKYPLSHEIAVDSIGRPHVIFQDWENCYYAYYNGTSWSIESVDYVWSSSYPCSIKVDSTRRPHIAYVNSSFRCVYAYRTGSTWNKTPLTTAAPPSLALDGLGRPHMARVGNPSEYTYYDGTSWRHIDIPEILGRASIAVDSSYRPHIAYYPQTDPYLKKDLKYAYYDGSSWRIETIMPGSDVYDAHATAAGAPEGAEYSMTTNGYWAGWGVFTRFTSPVDLSKASSLRFWVKTSKPLEVEIEDTSHRKSGVNGASGWYYANFTDYWDSARAGEWQEVDIPMDPIARYAADYGVRLDNVYGVFLATQDGWTSSDFLIDNVKWVLPIRADFKYQQTGAGRIEFIDMSGSKRGRIVSWSWDFNNDGITDSTEQNPIWNSATPGTHLVRLTVQDSTGLSVTSRKNVTVCGGSSIPDFVIYADTGGDPRLVGPVLFDGGDGSRDSPPWTVNISEVSGGSPSDPARSWKISYTNGPGYWGGFYYTLSTTVDLSGHTHLSFWVKGENGGEKFTVGLKGGSVEMKVPITNYATVGNSWQNVRIPLCDFSDATGSGSVDFTSMQIPWTISFTSSYPGDNNVVFIDNVRFIREPWMGP